MATIVSATDKPRRARRKKEGRRWAREVKAIALLVLAGFALVALATFDPAQPPRDQHGPAGPIGVWLGWALFAAMGYGAFLLPLVLGVIGLSIFVRPLVARGWPPVVGLAVLLVSAGGLLAQVSHLASGEAAIERAGGIVGAAPASGLRAGVGEIGTWLLLLAGLPIGVLFITQISFAAVSRMVGARIAQWRRRRAAMPGSEEDDGTITPAMAVADATPSNPALPPLVVVEPKRRGA